MLSLTYIFMLFHDNFCALVIIMSNIFFCYPEGSLALVETALMFMQSKLTKFDWDICCRLLGEFRTVLLQTKNSRMTSVEKQVAVHALQCVSPFLNRLSNNSLVLLCKDISYISLEEKDRFFQLASDSIGERSETFSKEQFKSLLHCFHLSPAFAELCSPHFEVMGRHQRIHCSEIEKTSIRSVFKDIGYNSNVTLASLYLHFSLAGNSTKEIERSSILLKKLHEAVRVTNTSSVSDALALYFNEANQNGGFLNDPILFERVFHYVSLASCCLIVKDKVRSNFWKNMDDDTHHQYLRLVENGRHLIRQTGSPIAAAAIMHIATFKRAKVLVSDGKGYPKLNGKHIFFDIPKSMCVPLHPMEINFFRETKELLEFRMDAFTNGEIAVYSVFIFIIPSSICDIYAYYIMLYRGW